MRYNPGKTLNILVYKVYKNLTWVCNLPNFIVSIALGKQCTKTLIRGENMYIFMEIIEKCSINPG